MNDRAQEKIRQIKDLGKYEIGRKNLLGRGSKNQNGNLRWHLPLGVRPPPLMAKFPDIFLPHFFSFAIESYIYETDFTLQKYHF